MGARVTASVIYFITVVLYNASAVDNEDSLRKIIAKRNAVPSPPLTADVSKRIFVETGPTENLVNSADSPLETAPTKYVPYGLNLFKFSPDDALDRYGKPINPYNNGYPVYEDINAQQKYQEFSSIEQDTDRYNDADFQHDDQFLDTNGYKHYKTQTSFSLNGPKQLETITTKSYHKEVEPYDVSSFKHSHDHDHHGDEEHAEVHYHQHKHLHKHSHKQSHVHKHKGEHKHEHGHKHSHSGKHSHTHESQHKHSHQGQHKHEHKGEHKHIHQGQHKHSHSGHHSHEHKHNAEHKHNSHHGHQHSHQSDHKHSHHGEHSHDHHHGHTHHSDHKHKHSHHGEHKHSHGHDHKHKHDHSSKHKHSHKHHKH